MKKLACALALLLCASLLCACAGTKDTITTPEQTAEPKATTGITFPLPEGFYETEIEGYQMWCAPDYPNDAANIVLSINTPVSEAEFSSQTEETYAASVEQAFKQAYGFDMDVLVNSF